MAFRDSFDQCPRCGVTLEDAHAARGCRSCGGVLVEEPVLSEMLLRMLPPPPRLFGTLDLREITRTGQPLSCPSCDEAMKPTKIHEVELDHCAKHGVWFDPDELQITLYRVADPKNPPPFKPYVFQPTVPASRPTPVPTKKPPPTPPQAAAAPRVVFQVISPNGNIREAGFQLGVIKVGKLRTCQLLVDDDPKVSRLHAVIEVERDAITVIDLGSTEGTFVNAERTNKQVLQRGDVIRVGDTTITLVTVE